MERDERLAFAIVAGAAAFDALAFAFQWAYAAGGLFRSHWDTLTSPPLTATKVLMIAAAVLALLGLPVALAEWRSDRRFRRRAETLRRERPLDARLPYEGPEGEGYLFEGPHGSVLLLRPRGGLGAPRLVERAPAAPPAADGAATPE